MKNRARKILVGTLLAGLFPYACGVIPNANTSVVTITIGDSPNTAVLTAEPATPWTRMKHLLAESDLVPEANAYIPSVVQVLIVTVTADDITPPIVGVGSIRDTDTAAQVRIEVPNGQARHFLVEGYRGVDSQVYYSGSTTADLAGADVTLPVSMGFVGGGIFVDPTFPLSANTPSCGSSPAAACATVTHVLTTRPATTNNDVIVALAGNYVPGAASPIETFPLQLKPGMVLLCAGADFSSVFDPQSQATTVLYGNDGASIDNCMIRVNAAAGGGIGINDAAGGQPLQQSRLRVNGVHIELGGFPTGAPNIGAMFFDDSLMLESAVTVSGGTGLLVGAQVSGGKPSVINSVLSGLQTGIDLAAGAGDALISGNTFSGNATGIAVATSAKPTISGNIISGAFQNGVGISVLAGTPRITGNVVRDNGTGIAISDASPEISGNGIFSNLMGVDIATAVGAPRVNDNSISCNSYYDAGVYDPQGAQVFDLRDNAWDHDASTNPSGPIVVSFWTGGEDIAVSAPTPTPQYVPFKAAVAGGCLPLVPAGKPSP